MSEAMVRMKKSGATEKRRSRSTSSATSSSAKNANLDPLDAAGKEPNMLTGSPEYSEARKNWAAVWSKFPVYALKDKLRFLVDSIAKNRVTVVVSGTGSGKTVLAVPLVLRHVLSEAKVHQQEQQQSQTQAQGQAPRPLKVVVTIPKKAAVAKAAETGALTLDVELGKEVGYLHRGSPSWAYDDRRTRLVYATDGTLLSQIRRDPLLRGYGAAVVDEAHERPVPTDLLLAALRKTLVERPDFRLVIMSATIDPKLFTDYFGSVGASTGVVEVSGVPMHPIERIHNILPGAVDGAPPKEYLPSTMEQTCKVLEGSHATPPQIIVFVPTTKDASQGCRALDKSCASKNAGAGASARDCFSLYGKMSMADRDGALNASRDAIGGEKRARVYVSTNVAESSITLDGITHVIDTGLQLSSTWDARAHGSKLTKGMATQAQITQRIGRSGRTGPGKAILLYSKEKFEAQPAYPQPAILGVDLAEHTMAELPRSSIQAVHEHFASLITPPSRDQVIGSIAALHFYGLVNVTDYDGTKKNTTGEPIPYDLIPYATLAPEEKPKKSSKSKKTTSGSKTVELVKDETPKWVSGFKGGITPLGEAVQRVADTAKLGVWNALLVVAGAAFDCVEDAFELAVILESCDGELSTLWKERSTPDQNPETSKLLKDTELAKAMPRSDHAALLGFYRENVAPRTKENKTIMEKYLSFGPWHKVFEAIRRDRGRIVQQMNERRAEIAEWFKKLAHVPLIEKMDVAPLIRAIAFSRCYLAATAASPPKKRESSKKKANSTNEQQQQQQQKEKEKETNEKLRTMFPIAKVELAVDLPIVVSPTTIPPKGVAFVESIVNAGGQWKAGGITWVPHAELASWLTLAISSRPTKGEKGGEKGETNAKKSEARSAIDKGRSKKLVSKTVT